MKRIGILVLTLSALTFASAEAVPARWPYIPEMPPATPMTVDLSGTAWLGKYGVSDRTYIFEADGTVSYKSTTKTIFKNRGKWRLEADTLIFEHHIGANKILDFRGVIRDTNTIVGEQILKTGQKSIMTLQRTAHPGK